MSKLKNRLMKRVLALVLSGAMIMSDAAMFQMTAFAAEESTGGGYEENSEEYEPEAAEITVKEDGDSDEKDADNATDMADNDKNDDVADDDKNDDATDSAADDDKDDDAADDVEPETVAESTEDVDNTDDSDEKATDSESAVDDAAVVETTVEDDPQEAEENTEEETSEAEVTEENVDNQASSATLSKGLKVGTNYGDSILNLSVLTDMDYNSSDSSRDEITNSVYTGCVVAPNANNVNNNPKVNGTNPSDTVGWIPTEGAAFKIETTKASKISFVIKKNTSDKFYYFVKDNGQKGEQLNPTDGTNKVPTYDSSDKNAKKAYSYTFDMDAGETYYFYVSGSRVSVYAITWEEIEIEIDEDSRKPWEDIANPEISKVGYKETDPSKIEVTVDSVVGLDGADTMTVYMYNAEDTENAIATVVSEKYQDSTTVTFAPTASGTYVFKAEIARKKRPGEEKTGELSEPFEFECPFVPPANLSAENLGGGNVQVKWDAVPGVDKYVVEIVDKANPGNVIPSVESKKASAVIFGLTEGSTYTFTVYSVKVNEDKTEQKSDPSESIDHKVAALSITWETRRYGNGIDTSNNKSSKISNNSVRLVSSNGKGKIVPASTDGLLFYCTTVSSKKNFTFTALAHVNSWKYSNGQEGFGVMAADRVGSDGSGSEFWNNSYQAIVSKVGYRWDGEGISTDDTGEKIDMHLGVGSTEKIGVTQDDLDEMDAGDITIPRNYSAVQTAIDSTYAEYGTGTYDIVGNCSNKNDRTDVPADKRYVEYQNFELQIQKNNTGYFVSYTKVDNNGEYILDANGNKITTTKKYYDKDALSKLTKGSIYVGVFTSRNADVTFSNMTLNVIDPEDDDSEEEKEVTYYNLATNILSSAVTNSSDYEFIFHSNWNGKLVVKDSAGNILTKNTETDSNGKETDYYNVTGSLDPEKSALLDGIDTKNTKIYLPIKDLTVGSNVFTVEYTPDKSWCPDKDEKTGKRYAELNSYDKVTITYTVEYRKYGERGQTIYVSQTGKSTNMGTKENPLDIYTAVKYAQPGQTIVLAGGTYSLTRTLQTLKGVDGKPKLDADGKETYEDYIKMIGDPEDVKNGNRPVLDFNGQVAAMVTCGNYWYFTNFDVIRCKDGEKGIQVSSSWCVFDRVDTYKNGSTGLQICRSGSTDTYKDWPHDNLILNCNSYLNKDSGDEDADGFAAKLTSGSNNVFDGCIAAFNADDGWDLFAKVQTGSIGGVVIRNSIAYRNGYYLVDDDGNLSETGTLTPGSGNGNGFKMGGDGVVAGSIYDTDENGDNYLETHGGKYKGHVLENSYSFYNKLKGFDSNSAPNVKAYNSVSFNNGGQNIGFSTYSKNNDTDYELKDVISFRTTGSTEDGISGKGSQKQNAWKNATTYLWSSSKSQNSNGDTVTKDDFVSLSKSAFNYDMVEKDKWRNDDGTIKMNGFLQLTDEAKSRVNAAPSMESTPSKVVIDKLDEEKDTNGSITGAVDTGDSTEDYGDDLPSDGLSKDHYGKIWVADICFDYEDRTLPIEYTGKQVTPELHVRFSADVSLLRKGKDYTVKYENNINAGTATAHVTGVGNYKGFTVDKEFKILKIAMTDTSIAIPSAVAAATGTDPKKLIKPTWQGKALKEGKDYTIKTINATTYRVTGAGNFGSNDPKDKPEDNYRDVTVQNIDSVPSDKLLNKASVKITTPAKELVYTGSFVEPQCEVKLGGSTLAKSTDYEVEFANNIEIGKATLTVVGKGNYAGSKSVTFNIKGGKIQDSDFITIDKGKVLTQYETNGVKFFGTDCKIPENTIKLTVKGGTPLINGEDYKIVQSGTNKAGTATVTIKGINNFTGSISYKFKITALDLEEIPESQFHIPDLPYVVGGAKHANLKITVGDYTVDATHYTLSYKNNTKAGDATVIVKGRNGLTGKREFPFKITPAEMIGNTDIVVSAKDVATNGKTVDGEIVLYASDLKKSTISVTQSYVAKGKTKTKKLSAGRDYDKKTIEYYIDTDDDYEIDPKKDKLVDITQKEEISLFKDQGGYVTVLVRVYAASGGNYKEGDYSDGYFRAALYDINKAKAVNNKSRVYGMNYRINDGTSYTIDWADKTRAKIEDYIKITYKLNGTETELTCNERTGVYRKNALNKAKYYAMDGFVIDATGYKKNDRVGTATFTIVGTGKYCGTKRVPFKIVSKETAQKMIDKNKGDEVENLEK